MMWEQCSNFIRTKITADDPSGFLIAECPANTPDSIKNARLIASAPELLEGIKSLYRAYVNMMEVARDRITELGGECSPVDHMEKGDPELIKVRSLIVKATGDT